MTFVGAVIGGVLLAVLNRRSSQPAPAVPADRR